MLETKKDQTEYTPPHQLYQDPNPCKDMLRALKLHSKNKHSKSDI